MPHHLTFVTRTGCQLATTANQCSSQQRPDQPDKVTCASEWGRKQQGKYRTGRLCLWLAFQEEDGRSLAFIQITPVMLRGFDQRHKHHNKTCDMLLIHVEFQQSNSLENRLNKHLNAQQRELREDRVMKVNYQVPVPPLCPRCFVAINFEGAKAMCAADMGEHCEGRDERI